MFEYNPTFLEYDVCVVRETRDSVPVAVVSRLYINIHESRCIQSLAIIRHIWADHRHRRIIEKTRISNENRRINLLFARVVYNVYCSLLIVCNSIYVLHIWAFRSKAIANSFSICFCFYIKHIFLDKKKMQNTFFKYRLDVLTFSHNHRLHIVYASARWIRDKASKSLRSSLTQSDERNMCPIRQ